MALADHNLKLEFSAILLATLLAGGQVLAHGNSERPLFVAEGGVDSGDCTNPARPCATIAFALSKAGKGGQIQVASGTYEIARAEDIFHLVGGVVNVSGGFPATFEESPVESGVSLLTGVPYEYREILENRGFQILADIKGIDRARASEAGKLLGLHLQLKGSIAAAPCIGGQAAGLPCDKVDLLSHVGFSDISSTPNEGNDIWGFVDLNTGREYAIVGFNLGTAVFDVTDAENPREVGFVDGQSATWRDIKVYQAFDDNEERWKSYAYVTTDGSTDGLFVIDLTALPHRISRLPYASDISRAHNVYAANTDFSTGVPLTGGAPTLVVAGATIIDNGRFRAYSLTDPESPSLIGGGGIGYMHDAASMQITDARKDTQCANAIDYCDLLLDFNENSFEIWDVTIPATPVRLSNTPYGNARYVHSGWWSEDKRYIFVHDELDERDLALPTTLRVFDVGDLTQPTLAGNWTGPTNAIDHNGFVRGNRYYMSNYSRGLTVLDITSPSAPVAAGRLDTYPASDGNMFVGAWGAYPFFHSGNIAVSDIDSGFYMVADRTRDVVEGRLEFTVASFAAEENQVVQLEVARLIGSTGAISVAYEVLNATTDSSDYTLNSGTLDWPDGDSTSRTIDISLTNDGVAESLERMIVRLVNPVGGATLGDRNTASVYVSDPLAVSEVRFLESDVQVTERGFGKVLAVAHRTGSAVGAASITYALTGGDATPGSDFTGSTAGTLTWADGDGDPKVIEFILADDGTGENDETFEIGLSNPVGLTITGPQSFVATILDGNGANLAPVAIAGSGQTSAGGAQVVLNGNQSNDPNGDQLIYQWTQISGINVTLVNPGSPSASFTAPSVASDTLLQFNLTVTDPGGLSDSAVTTVTVARTSTTAPSPGGGGSIGLLSLLCLLAAAGLLNLRRRDAV